MLLFRKIVYLMSVVIICFDVPKYLSCVLFASLIASAFTKELRTLVAFLTRRFVCMCAGGKISRLAGIHLEDIPCVIACVEWLGTAQVRARDFDYFSTDFVRSVFVVYAHDSI